MVKTADLYNYCEQHWKIDYLKVKCLNISYGLDMFISLTRAFHSGCWTSFSLISTLVTPKFWGLPLWKEVWSVPLYATTRSVHPFFKVFCSSSTYEMLSYYAMTLPRPTGPLPSLCPPLRGIVVANLGVMTLTCNLRLAEHWGEKLEIQRYKLLSLLWRNDGLHFHPGISIQKRRCYFISFSRQICFCLAILGTDPTSHRSWTFAGIILRGETIHQAS